MVARATVSPAPTRHKSRSKSNTEERRILLLDKDKAKPNSESWNFLKRQSKICGKGCIEFIEIQDKKEIKISENACPLCLTRAKQCPAVKVVKLPSNLSTDTTHRYGANSFKLHGLPIPRPGHVLGLLGCNGTGKSTALQILSGELTPNLGCSLLSDGATPPTWQEIVRYYRGSDLQNYFTNLMLKPEEERLVCVTKPQLNASFGRQFVGEKVGDVLRSKDERGILNQIQKTLELSHLLHREVQQLSGGELQRFAIASCILREADVYLFDEISSFLDSKQRLIATDLIRGLVDSQTYRAEGRDPVSSKVIANSKYVVMVEHDLTVLDYASDFVCCLYGEPGAYGVITKRQATARGINQFLAGYIATENIRFRSEALTFHPAPVTDGVSGFKDIDASSDSKGANKTKEVKSNENIKSSTGVNRYPSMSRTLGSKDGGSSFTLHVEAGSFRKGEIIGLLGRNGTGKTTFMEMLAGEVTQKELKAVQCTMHGKQRMAYHPKVPPAQTYGSLKSLGISYKRQNLGSGLRTFQGTVQEFLEATIQQRLGDRLFRLFVMKPLAMEKIEQLQVRSLSGGEQQRLAICVSLGTPAQLYLLDEPSAGLDCEQRLIVAKVIKRWVVSHLGLTAFVIEHDMVMASAMYDRVVVYRGTPGVNCTAGAPVSPADGFNSFLRQLGITFKRDRANYRPRINKRGSRLDREQKASGDYFSFEIADDG